MVEGLFLSVTTNFEGEINALSYRKAALFSFTLALVSYNILATVSLTELGEVLKQLADQVDLKRFRKQPRKKKTKAPPRVKDPKHPHVSTAKLLSGS